MRLPNIPDPCTNDDDIIAALDSMDPEFRDTIRMTTMDIAVHSANVGRHDRAAIYRAISTAGLDGNTTVRDRLSAATTDELHWFANTIGEALHDLPNGGVLDLWLAVHNLTQQQLKDRGAPSTSTKLEVMVHAVRTETRLTYGAVARYRAEAAINAGQRDVAKVWVGIAQLLTSLDMSLLTCALFEVEHGARQPILSDMRTDTWTPLGGEVRMALEELLT